MVETTIGTPEDVLALELRCDEIAKLLASSSASNLAFRENLAHLNIIHRRLIESRFALLTKTPT